MKVGYDDVRCDGRGCVAVRSRDRAFGWIEEGDRHFYRPCQVVLVESAIRTRDYEAAHQKRLEQLR